MSFLRRHYRWPKFFAEPPDERLFGPAPPRDFVDNGCTYSPDGWWGKACRWHDYHYSASSDVSRLMADFLFFLNLWVCRAPWTVTFLYPLTVRWHGREHYDGQKSNW
jgi:hypothetical protein